MENWLQQIDDLNKNGLSIRIIKDGKTLFESAEPMLKPLFLSLQNFRIEMAGATVVDKIVGRAAAYLCAIAKVKQVITPLASESAADVLRKAGIVLSAQRMVPQIMNRNNTDICPMEKMSGQYPDAEAFYLALAQRIQIGPANP